MNSSFRRRIAAGFTLIELLIVVIIIAILAAIAIPQFANTTGDAQESTLDANLGTMRSAVEMYRIQHNNVLPGSAASSGGDACASGGTQGGGGANSAVAFGDQLTQYSDAKGHTCTVGGGSYIYGPYLRALPTEPLTPSTAVTIVQTAGAAAAPTDTTGGWRFNTTTGRLDMNTSANDRKGSPLYQH